MVEKFPDSFLLGVSSSSYQIEGAWDADGKGESIWDRFTHAKPGRENGDVAADHYHRMKEDVQLLHVLGMETYRFSISWPRVFPSGTGEPNQAGIQFYKDLVALLTQYDIKPAVTLYHWDLPQALQDRGGWINPDITDAFAEYARFVFQALGDDVAVWITHNEPWVAAFMGYGSGQFAPGIQDWPSALKASHHIMLSHGKAVRIYRELGLKGKIGISLDYFPATALSDSEQDQLAALRDRQSHIGWFADPILRGAYPEYLWKWYQEQGLSMPAATPEDLALISEKIDFLGINYYRGAVARYQDGQFPLNFAHVESEMDKTSRYYALHPEYLYDYLQYLHSRYDGIEIMITENGYSAQEFLDRNRAVDDPYRIDYIFRHLEQCQRAIADGINVSAYYVWCFLDDFEWSCTYNVRMGIVYVDYHTGERIIKKSGRWYSEVIRKRHLLP